MTNCFAYLKKKQAKGRKIIYMPNPGNLGDSLIASATLQQFERHGLSYEVMQRQMTHAPENLYVYAGGGNLVPYYKDAENALRALSAVGASFCLLPHSCFGVDEVLMAYAGDLVIFARENKTYEYLRGLNKRDLRVELSHDIALSLDLADPRLLFSIRPPPLMRLMILKS